MPAEHFQACSFDQQFIKSDVIYAPTFGAMYYAGLRFKIKDKKENHKIEELNPIGE